MGKESDSFVFLVKIAIMEILYLLAGIALGSIVFSVIMNWKLHKQHSNNELKRQTEQQQYIQDKFELEKEKDRFEDRNRILSMEREQLLLQIQQLQIENNTKSQQLARNEADFDNLQEKLESQKKEILLFTM